MIYNITFLPLTFCKNSKIDFIPCNLTDMCDVPSGKKRKEFCDIIESAKEEKKRYLKEGHSKSLLSAMR